jgi:ribonuclease HI
VENAPCDAIPVILHPATVYITTKYPGYFQINYSTNPFPDTLPDSAPVWDADPTTHAFVDTPEFYSRLLSHNLPTSFHTGQDIATSLELETLVACSDGSYDPNQKIGGHGWVLSTTDRKTILEGAGPADGHPYHMSSYRTELGGLVAVLYIIFRICSHYQVTAGKLTYYCDNKGVLSNIFRTAPITVTGCLQTDFDLVLVAKRLVSLLPITIVAEWVKGHYDGGQREHKHDLNHRADTLAAHFTHRPPPRLKTATTLSGPRLRRMPPL